MSPTSRSSPVRSAADELAAAISAAGPIPFDEFVRIALYGESGFYTRGGGAGRRRDFLTSPEVGPLFGAVIARMLDATWDEIGRPDPFTVVDVGAGPGTLARSIRLADPRCSAAMRYVAVEIAESAHELHPEWVESRTTMPDGQFDGVILANELLDNLPFRLFVMDDGWREAHVAMDGDRFVEVLVDPAQLPSCLPPSAAHGARAPVQDSAVRWASDASRLVRSGSLVSVDYASTTAEMAMRPWREWLRTYRGHARGGHYLASPGEQDVTVEVALDQLVSAVPGATVSTQADWLGRWGIDALVAEGVDRWKAAAGRPDLAAMRMRSRLREAEALRDPAGLGTFRVLEWRVGHRAETPR